jgi:hypothetical protein
MQYFHAFMLYACQIMMDIFLILTLIGASLDEILRIAGNKALDVLNRRILNTP